MLRSEVSHYFKEIAPASYQICFMFQVSLRYHLRLFLRTDNSGIFSQTCIYTCFLCLNRANRGFLGLWWCYDDDGDIALEKIELYPSSIWASRSPSVRLSVGRWLIQYLFAPYPHLLEQPWRPRSVSQSVNWVRLSVGQPGYACPSVNRGTSVRSSSLFCGHQQSALYVEQGR